MSHVGEPLAGCAMVITADRRKREFASALERRGATVHHAPALSTISHLDDEQLIADSRALIAAPPDIVVATTGIGFRGWIEAADAAGLAEDLLDCMRDARLIARGPKARGAIQAAGLEADWVAETETAAELQDYLLAEGVSGLRIAVQHHGNGSDGLDEAFEEAGADVQSLLIYGWGPPLDPAAHQRWIDGAAAGHADAVLFTSAPGSHAWLTDVRRAGLFDAISGRVHSGDLLLAGVGPVTAAPLEGAGLPTCFPDRWRLGALVRELVKHYGEATEAIATPDGPLVMRATAAVLDGEVLPLTPTGLEILRALAKAGGNVLTREQLGELLPGAQAGPHAVEAAINRLRENAGSRSLVRTVVKRGYALGVSA
ncbi:uroporphyrinogen-III synthase [Demequina muriae]|uniref:Uroporphyrinogen-III synthase n=1 Tax=Demequina muriae TaxID=3051664 RepID=A0ABT8GJI0_9MICO|nr:uroporphyrinogen-III synthase [Demequina sp. EGI L300058]MDN4481399.1 uroporphyrinogen-III synthase [Demequina sp. EGI L300058]